MEKRTRLIVSTIAMVVVMALVSCSEGGGSAPPVATGSGEAPPTPAVQTLSIIDVRSGEEAAFTAPAGASGFAFTFDGAAVAFSNTDANGTDQIFVMDADGSNVRQITFGSRGARHPLWAPDGSVIAYEGDTETKPQIFEVRVADGASNMLTDEPLGAIDPGGWAPDGGSIVYSSDDGTQFTTRSVDLGTGTSSLIVPDGSTPALSPDGALLAFNSWAKPTVRLIVANSDGSDRRTIALLDNDDAYEKWSPDSTQLAYLATTEEGGYGTYVYELATGEVRFVTESSVKSWVDGDHILVS